MISERWFSAKFAVSCKSAHWAFGEIIKSRKQEPLFVTHRKRSAQQENDGNLEGNGLGNLATGSSESATATQSNSSGVQETALAAGDVNEYETLKFDD